MLLPHLADVLVEQVENAGSSVRIQASTRGSSASCPGCGTVSGRVHSRYERKLLDTATGGREVVICLTVRRFLCPDPGCAKVTFAEQVSGLTSPNARRSPGADRMLTAVALALGGRAGARLSGRLAVCVSRMTLLRLIRALPDPAPGRAPRVLGVDEFALRRGRRYGTLLVDVETRRPVDILDDRSADSFAAWLEAHPGAELICRDRAGCYSDGGRRGAPDAVQVADRWHLWHNLGEAVERAVARHRQHLPAAVTAPPEPSPANPPAAPVLRSDRVAARTRRRHADVHRLLAAGRTYPEIAAGLGITRNTVRRFARASDPEELLVRDGTGRRPRTLDDYESYLRERWNSGCTNAAQLHQEIRGRGYPGSARAVRGYLARFRGTGPVPAPAAAPPKTRAVTSWIMTRPGTLDAGDQASLDAILAASPELAAVTSRVREFAEIMTELRGQDLQQWMTAADATGEPALRSFVTGLRADQDAVTAGLTLPWSSGSVEGNVNRIKMIKRQMYGRAGPELLRLRVLLAD
ncbi:MAG TPA: ISL3 family transposase [Streptosporangiaceae bacterium]